jgi:hypothetical protein
MSGLRTTPGEGSHEQTVGNFHRAHAQRLEQRKQRIHGHIMQKAGPRRNRLLVKDRKKLAAVAFAAGRRLAGFRTADLAAIGALAGLAFDTTVFVDVRASDTTGAAMREDLTGGQQRRGHD